MQNISSMVMIAAACGLVAGFTLTSSISSLYTTTNPVSTTTSLQTRTLPIYPRVASSRSIEVVSAQPQLETSLVGFSSSSAHTWSTPCMGAMGLVFGFLIGRAATSRNEHSRLQPLAMLGYGGSSSMITPAEALALWAPKESEVSILDVRSEMEGREGRIRSNNKGSIDVPLINARSRYDSDTGGKVVTQEVNPKFVQEVQAKIPKNKKVIVMCSDGGSRTAQALSILASAGYTNLVGLAGGYNKWDQLYDRMQKERPKSQQDTKAAALQDPIRWTQWSSAGGSMSTPTAAPAPSAPSPSAWSAAPAPAAARAPPSSSGVVTGNYNDPSFQAATLSAFPPKANATVEEARVLWKLGGYSLVDIRSEMECREGHVRGPNKGSIEIPMFHARSMYDSTLGKRVVTQEVNPKWLEQMTEKFPRDAKIIIMCSDGTTRSSQALDLLAAAGYTNLVMLRGGYNRWDQVFDKQLFLRSPAQQAAKAEWLDDDVQWGSWSGTSGFASPPPRVVTPSMAPVARTERVMPSQGSFSEPSFQAATIAAFPARGTANIDESRVLWKLDGYSIVDIRSDMEGQEGRIRGPNKGSIDIPLVNARSRYDSSVGGKVVIQEPNTKWLEQMKARFSPDAKIILMCSDGTARSSAAAKQLSSAGFRNVVVMDGGYMAWEKRFDKFLAPRPAGSLATKPSTDSIKWNVGVAQGAW